MITRTVFYWLFRFQSFHRTYDPLSTEQLVPICVVEFAFNTVILYFIYTTNFESVRSGKMSTATSSINQKSRYSEALQTDYSINSDDRGTSLLAKAKLSTFVVVDQDNQDQYHTKTITEYD